MGQQQNTPAPWSYRKLAKHFAIEAANGVRVAEVAFIGRPDGSTSEDTAALIVSAVNAALSMFPEPRP